MNRDELIKLIIYQRERMEAMEVGRKESDRRISELTDKISALTEQLRKSNDAMSAMTVHMSELMWHSRQKRKSLRNYRGELTTRRNPCRTTLTWRKGQGTRQMDRMRFKENVAFIAWARPTERWTRTTTYTQSWNASRNSLPR